MNQQGVYKFLKDLEILLEKSFPILPNYMVMVKVKEVETILDAIYSSLPNEVQEARAFLRRKDELQMEAQQKAERILIDAENERARQLSESNIYIEVQKRAEKIKEQVIEECDQIRRKALEDAENIRLKSADEAIRIREGAELFAEQVFTTLEKNLGQLQQDVKNGQIYIEKLRSESVSTYASTPDEYSPQQKRGKSDKFEDEFQIG